MLIKLNWRLNHIWSWLNNMAILTLFSACIPNRQLMSGKKLECKVIETRFYNERWRIFSSVIIYSDGSYLWRKRINANADTFTEQSGIIPSNVLEEIREAASKREGDNWSHSEYIVYMDDTMDPPPKAFRDLRDFLHNSAK